LIDSLIRLRLIELPDINDVPGMISFGLHGNRFALEIASRHNYKFCNYSNLDYYLVRNEWPASNMAKAIKLISDECGFSCFPTR
jgi:hypothetical protein